TAGRARRPLHRRPWGALHGQRLACLHDRGQAMSAGFADAVALTTGAAQGLGLGMAQELARRGARVVIADVQADKAEAAAELLRMDGLKAEAVYLDVADPASVEATYAAIVAKHGRLDFAVHNAGV